MTVLGEAVVEVRADTTGVDQDIEKGIIAPLDKAEDAAKDFEQTAKKSFAAAGGSLEKFAKSAVVPATIALGALTGAAGGAIKQASDLSESINAVNVTFGDAATGILNLGEKAATAVGLSNSEFNGLAVRFSGFTKQVAGDGGDVVGTMQDLTTRAADFASVMNLDVNDAAQIFQSSLAGESESIRRFGIDMSAAAVETQALTMGLGTVTKTGVSLTESEKVMARYALLMDSTASTAGDFANTSDGLANSQRIASAQIKDAGAKIGTVLMPPLAKVVGMFASFAQFASRNTTLVLVLGGAIAFLAGTIIAINTAYKIYNTYQKLQAMLAARQAAANTALNATFLANPIFLVIAAVVALVAAFVVAYQKVEWFRNAVDAVVDFIMGAFQAVADFFVAVWDTAFGIVRGYLDIFFTVWGAVFDAITGVVKFYIGIWTGIFSTLWNALKAGFEGVKKIASGIFDGLAGAFRGAINLVLGGLEAGLNFAIRGLNIILDGIDKAAGPWVNFGSIPEVDFPRLANGAIVNSRTTAMVGEAGPEAVIPITRPARAMQLMEQSGLASMVRARSGAAVNIENAIFRAPVDADLVAQKVITAELARSFAA